MRQIRGKKAALQAELAALGSHTPAEVGSLQPASAELQAHECATSPEAFQQVIQLVFDKWHEEKTALERE